jgi:hypothetical protein
VQLKERAARAHTLGEVPMVRLGGAGDVLGRYVLARGSGHDADAAGCPSLRKRTN